jgi:hypothetical protein
VGHALRRGLPPRAQARLSLHGEEICDQGKVFRVTAHFRVPDDAIALSEERTEVKVFGEPPNTNNYRIQGWTFANAHLSSNPKTADIIISLYRRPGLPTPEVPYETIVVTVAGDFAFRGFSGTANIKITCP